MNIEQIKKELSEKIQGHYNAISSFTDFSTQRRAKLSAIENVSNYDQVKAMNELGFTTTIMDFDYDYFDVKAQEIVTFMGRN